MREPVTLVRAVIAMMLLAGASPAFAGDKTARLAVLPIIIAGPHGEASLSSVLADVSDAADRRLGIRLISQEEIFVAGSGDLGKRVRDCGSDIACIANRLRAFDARFGLVVVVNLVLDPPLISLQLLDTDERRLVAQSTGELESGVRVSAAIRRRANTLLNDAGYSKAGRVIVDVTPAAARVTLNGEIEPDEGKGNVFTIAAGRYDVQASADGFDPATGVAVVLADKVVHVPLMLEEQTSVFGSVWFWAVVGAAVAGGTTAAIVATRPTTRCLCTTINGIGCEVCE